MLPRSLRDKTHNARPDIVLFINGIPFAVIECKAPQISVEQAVEQNIRNQQKEYIPQLYKFAQIVMATNKNAVKYATTGTPKKLCVEGTGHRFSGEGAGPACE